jgi:2-polyprenyl-6-hydroxyphenyl methylase/3-demethylubiquinone-9 3-methyltransferase
LEQELANLKFGARARVFDLGCGNGALASHLHSLGFDVSGVDPSYSGIQNAARYHRHVHLNWAAAMKIWLRSSVGFPS